MYPFIGMSHISIRGSSFGLATSPYVFAHLWLSKQHIYDNYLEQCFHMYMKQNRLALLADSVYYPIYLLTATDNQPGEVRSDSFPECLVMWLISMPVIKV